MLALMCVICGSLSRIFFAAPNFTPVIALALFGGFYLSRKQALIVPVTLFAITDFIIGFHPYMVFTWGSALLVAIIGLGLRGKKRVSTVIGGGFLAAGIYFLITNFSYWLLSGLYTPDMSGLVACYVAALPFFRNSLVSTLVYGVIIFGFYEFISAKVRDTRFAHVLLTT